MICVRIMSKFSDLWNLLIKVVIFDLVFGNNFICLWTNAKIMLNCSCSWFFFHDLCWEFFLQRYNRGLGFNHSRTLENDTWFEETSCKTKSSWLTWWHFLWHLIMWKRLKNITLLWWKLYFYIWLVGLSF